MEGSAGNRGSSVRSDCYVRISLEGEGIVFNLKSKVNTLYGRSIRNQIDEMLQFYGIMNARVEMEDAGALPYVIAARVEAAVRRLMPHAKEFLLPVPDYDFHPTLKDNLRRSRLYIPGNNPKLIVNAGLYGSDGIILDLEDSVATDKKEEARILVRNALRNNDLMGSEKMVRINGLPEGLKDLDALAHQPLHMILIPKCESAEEVRTVDEKISQLPGKKNDPVWLMPILETARGIQHAFEIAAAAPSVAALAIGLEDYTFDIGTMRTPEGWESFHARSVVVNASRAAGIQPIDSVFSDFGNHEELRRLAKASKAMGFEGMGCIHPGQIRIIHESFAPTPAEIGKSKKIILAFEKAAQEGVAVTADDSGMIDAPVVGKAKNIINQAIKTGLLQPAWRECEESGINNKE